VTTAPLDRDAFLDAMAARFISSAALTSAQAREHADATLSCVLDMEQIAFGDPEWGWSEAEAVEMVDDELAHWADA
jgi:hypothetical protein